MTERPARGGEGQELSPLKRAFLAVDRLQGRVRELERGRREPIAVVGIGCRFPGGASTPEAFDELLRSGVDAVVPRPPVSRPGWSDLVTDEDLPPAGYLREDPSAFDPLFFGIAPREAATIDPQQRLVLECAWEALEHAAINPRGLEGSSTGVYVGVASTDWSNLQLRGTPDAGVLQSHFAAGVGHSMVSGRLSYVLGLQGPSISFDTACSSSLVALHAASQALRGGECDLALAGGVNLILAPDFTVAFQQSQMLSADGRCRTFDAGAGGFSRGEGCGIVVLRRLSDAVASGDRILAVIRGSAVNQDGPSSGLTAPNGPAQEAVIRSALEVSGVEPASVAYVEAHGTGTILGDPIEVQALGAAYGRNRPPERPLLIGSVKTNLGHLEAAAGIAGFIKVVMALESRTLPPHLHFRDPNPHIPWDRLPVEVTAAARPFDAVEGVRRAGLSSFGFSGTNVHLILEEAPEPVPAAAEHPGRGVHVLPISGSSAEGLAHTAAAFGALLQELDTGGETAAASFPDVCHTAGVGRAALGERLALVAESREEAIAALQSVGDGSAAPSVFRGRAGPEAPGLAFLYTGQGAQREGMGRELYDTEPVVRETLDRAAEVLGSELGQPFLPMLFGEIADPGSIHRTELAQPALMALELALSALWQSWGIRPDRVMGHSVGEYAAAVDAGIMTFDDGLRLIAARGRLMQALPPGGAMAAILAEPETLVARIAETEGAVSLAAVNAPDSVVLSGDEAAVEALVAELAREGVQHRRLSVSHAFHSRRMEPMLEAFREAVSRVRLSPPRIPLVSNVTGRAITADEATDPDYWCRHIRQPVLFGAGVQSLVQGGIGVLLECGPDSTLSGMAARSLEPDTARCIPSIRSGRGESRSLAEAVAGLFTLGHAVDWAARDAGRPVRRLALPRTVFQRAPFWFPGAHRPPVAAPTGPAWRTPDHPLLGSGMRLADGSFVFDRSLTADTVPYLADHRVNGEVIVPATVHVELLRAAAGAGLGWLDVGIDDLTIREALVLDASTPRSVQLRLDPLEGGGWRASIHSLGPDDEAFRLHAEALLVDASSDAPTHDTGADAEGAAAFPDAEAAASLWGGTETMNAEAFYAALVRRGLDFGPAFQGVAEVWQGEGMALGRLTAPEALDEDAYPVHPAMLDAGIQVLSAAVPGSAGDNLYLPLGIRRLRFHPGGGAPRFSRVRVEPGDPNSADPSRSLAGTVVVLDASGRPVVSVEGIQLARVRPSAAAGGAAGSWVHRVSWERAEGARGQVGGSPRALVEVADRAVVRLGAELGADAYGDVLDALESLSADFIVQALVTLGWDPAAGDEVRVPELMERLGILPRHERLTVRMMRVLEGAGVLRASPLQPGTWRVEAPLDAGDPAARARKLMERFSPHDAELQVTARCGAGLSGVLTGQVDPLELLFPGGDTAAQARIYRDTPLARTLNGALREVVGGLVSARSPGRPLRILEIGAGTGGTTAHVLDVLPEEGVRYTFTDIGRLFVNRGRETFGDRPGMHFAVLDIDRDPGDQGFESGAYDLILASNVLHATRDLGRTLERVRALLAPGGTLCMLEVTEARGWVDLTVGLTEGWWLYEDEELRRENPVLDREAWLELLERSGFASPAATRAMAPATGLGGQSILLAQLAEAPARRQWMIFCDEGGTGRRAAERLGAEGDTTYLVDAGVELRIGEDGATVPPENPEAFRKLLESAPLAPTDVAVFWPLDAPMLATEEARLAHALGGVLHLVQAVLREEGQAPRLHLITRGAQAASDDVEPLDPTQAAVWGLARSLLTEHPELECSRLDLDPASSDWSAADHAELTELASREPERALRGGERRVPRLRRVALSEPSSEPRRLYLGKSGLLEDLACLPTKRQLPGPDEIEIEIAAAGMNFRDVVHALGVRSDVEALGAECVGRVVAVGSEVLSVAEGEWVLAARGALGTHATVHAGFCVRVPESLSIVEAATLPIAFLTAHRALSVAGMQSGQKVLVHAGAGGVGMAAVQLAVAAGLEVYATAGTPAKRDQVRALGARDVFDSRSLTFENALREATGGAGVDIVVNSLAGAFIPASLRGLSEGGVLVELGKTGEWDETRAQALEGTRAGIRYIAVDLSDDLLHRPAVIQAELATLVDRVASGELRPLPSRIFPLSRAEEAFRHMAAGRHTGKLVLVPDGSFPVRSDATYLVTGGLSGLGLRVAQRLAERGAGGLILAGRSAPSDEARAALAQMEASGTRVAVVQADVSVPGALAEGLGAVQGLPPLRGVIHSAGVLRDGVLVQQSWEDMLHVLRPKAMGIREVEAATQAAPLDFFVIFSSVASFLGSPGQANHAAANAYLDALALDRVARGLPAVSLAWGAWGEIGAAVRHGVNERAARRGLGTIDPERGLALMEQLTHAGHASVMVSPMNWSEFVGSGPVPAFLEGVARTPRSKARRSPRPEPRPGATATTAATATRSLAEEMAATPPARRRALLRERVRQSAVRVLGLPSGYDLDERQPLGDIGLDSLMAVELRNALGSLVGRTLPATLLFDHPNVGALTEWLGRDLPGAAPAAAKPSAAPAATPAPGAHATPGPAPAAPAELDDIEGLLGRIEGLSEEEVERRVQRDARVDQEVDQNV